MAHGRMSSKARARIERFAELFIYHGENATRAVLDSRSGFKARSTESAAVIGHRLLRNVNVLALINKRREKLLRDIDLDLREVVGDAVRDIRFDPIKLLDDQGNPLPPNRIDLDTRK